MKNKLILIFLSGFIVRLILLSVYFYHDYRADENDYHLLAKNLYSGIGYSLDNKMLTTYRNPGYPFFLASIYKIFSENPVAVKIIQCFFNSFTAILIFFIAKLMFTKNIALFSALVAALHPIIAIYCVQLYSESFYTVIFLIAIYFSVKSIYINNKIDFLLSGIFWGVCFLTRSATIFYFLPVFIWHLWVYLKNIIKPLLIITGVILVLLPWTVRNYNISGKICPLGTGVGGIVFWIATYLPWGGDNPGYDKEPLNTYLHTYKDDNLDKFMVHKAIDNIKKWPFQYIIMSLKRIKPLWFSSHSAAFEIRTPNLIMIHNKEYFKFFFKFILFILNTTILLSNVLFLVLNKKYIKKYIIFLLLIIGFTLHIFLAVSARYTVPYLPLSVIPFIFLCIKYNKIINFH